MVELGLKCGSMVVGLKLEVGCSVEGFWVQGVWSQVGVQVSGAGWARMGHVVA